LALFYGLIDIKLGVLIIPKVFHGPFPLIEDKK